MDNFINGGSTYIIFVNPKKPGEYYRTYENDVEEPHVGDFYVYLTEKNSPKYFDYDILKSGSTWSEHGVYYMFDENIKCHPDEQFTKKIKVVPVLIMQINYPKIEAEGAQTFLTVEDILDNYVLQHDGNLFRSVENHIPVTKQIFEKYKYLLTVSEHNIV